MVNGDNQSVVTNTSETLSKLNKKHTSISFHRVREAYTEVVWVLHTKNYVLRASTKTSRLPYYRYLVTVEMKTEWRSPNAIFPMVGSDAEFPYSESEDFTLPADYQPTKCKSKTLLAMRFNVWCFYGCALMNPHLIISIYVTDDVINGRGKKR